MNWILVIIMWGHHQESVTQLSFQTKFLCEKAIDSLDYVNTTNSIPVGTFARCVQSHRSERPDRPDRPTKPDPTPTPSPSPETQAEEVETSNG